MKIPVRERKLTYKNKLVSVTAYLLAGESLHDSVAAAAATERKTAITTTPLALANALRDLFPFNYTMHSTTTI